MEVRRYHEVGSRRTGGTYVPSGQLQSHMGLVSTLGHNVCSKTQPSCWLSPLWKRKDARMDAVLPHGAPCPNSLCLAVGRQWPGPQQWWHRAPRHHRACLLPRTLTSSAYGEGAKSGRKAVRKRKAKTWETERWHSLHSLKQWVYFYLCHKGQRAHVVISNTASSWPRRDYVRQHWNHNVSHGNGAGGLLIALGIQRYHSHPACSNCLGEREIVNSLGEKKNIELSKIWV